MTRSVFGASYARLREILVAARRKSGLTQVDVAAKLHRPQSFVSKVESGERRLDVVELIQFAEAVGANPSQMVEDVARVRDKKANKPHRA